MEPDTCISCFELLIDAAITNHLYKCLSIVLSCADVVYSKFSSRYQSPQIPIQGKTVSIYCTIDSTLKGSSTATYKTLLYPKPCDSRRRYHECLKLPQRSHSMSSFKTDYHTQTLLNTPKPYFFDRIAKTEKRVTQSFAQRRTKEKFPRTKTQPPSTHPSPSPPHPSSTPEQFPASTASPPHPPPRHSPGHDSYGTASG